MKNSNIQFNEKFLNEVIRQAKIIHPKTVLVVEPDEKVILDRLEKEDIGQKRFGVNTSASKKEGISSFSFKTNAFDLVICCDVLQSLKNPKKALSELYRVADRYVILAVPNTPMRQLANFLRGENLLQLGKDKSNANNWTSEGFEAFAETKFVIFTNKRPFPWTILVGEKT